MTHRNILILIRHLSEATEAKGSGVDNRAGAPFPTAAVSCSQKRREGEGTPDPPPPQSRQESAANERAALTQRGWSQRWRRRDPREYKSNP